MSEKKPNPKIIVLVIVILSIIATTAIVSNIKPNKIQLSGTIESTQIDINSEVAGRVIKLINDEGDCLKTNDTVAVIDSSNQQLIVKQQEASLENAKINFDYWSDMFNRIKPVYNSGNTSEQNYLNTRLSLNTAKQQYEQIQASLDIQKLLLSKFNIKSPIDGIYLSRNVEVGDLVNIGSNIATISDLTNLWVKFYIPQKYLTLVNLKQKVNMKSPAFKNEILNGEITYISDQAEFTPKNTETEEAKENTVFKLKVKIISNEKKLKPGMTINVSIPVNKKENL